MSKYVNNSEALAVHWVVLLEAKPPSSKSYK